MSDNFLCFVFACCRLRGDGGLFAAAVSRCKLRSIEVTTVYVIFVVFSPLLALLLVVDAAKRKSLGKHSELDK